jgi:hypothetical protein
MLQVIFPKTMGLGHHAPVLTRAQYKARRLFFNRMAKRKHVHGANWRQVWVDCGGQCVKCGSGEYLEFHEPFGEEGCTNGWGRMQTRLLICFSCHCAEHPENTQNMENGWGRKTGNTLNDDIQLEIWMHGGWDQWIKDFKLNDTYGRLLGG